jgi:hypothetical protein
LTRRSHHAESPNANLRSAAAMNTFGKGLDYFHLKSRVLRAVYYDVATRKMVVQTTHGRFLIYRDIDREIVDALASHPSPGVLFDQHLRKPMKSRRERMTLTNLLLLRRVRKIAKAGLKAGPYNEADQQRP